MSEEDFLRRWSRLKRKSDTDKKSATGPSTAGDAPDEEGSISAAGPGTETNRKEGGGTEEPPFDPASLPPVESITAASDIRAFLQSAVPADLAKAALRRAWTTDPAIRDFIGIAENQWDFTDPTAIPGFGPLAATDDLGQLVTQAMGKLGEMSKPNSAVALPVDTASPVSGEPALVHTQAPTQVVGIPEINTTDTSSARPVKEQDNEPYTALQHGVVRAEVGIRPNRRTHGGALPE